MLGFVPRAPLAGPELMQALFGATEAEISLLPRTKASQATSEAAWGKAASPGLPKEMGDNWEPRPRWHLAFRGRPGASGPVGCPLVRRWLLLCLPFSSQLKEIP